MSFSFRTFQGEAENFAHEVETELGHPREQEIINAIKDATKKIVEAVGGHVAVSVRGHINETPDRPGDNVNVQVSSFLRPQDPTPDTGLAAAAGSARSFPPEASTAAPQTSDGSPPAKQDPVPQPAVEPAAPSAPVDEEPVSSDPTSPPASEASPVLDTPAEDSSEAEPTESPSSAIPQTPPSPSTSPEHSDSTSESSAAAPESPAVFGSPSTPDTPTSDHAESPTQVAPAPADPAPPAEGQSA